MRDATLACDRGRARATDAFRVGVVVPIQGPAGIFGPSCESVATLAAARTNAAGGVLGRPVEIQVIDGGATPRQVAGEVKRLTDAGALDAVTGWHISAVRHQLTKAIKGRIPYVYTSLYEGGETSPGVYCSGETPRNQLEPALRWMRDHAGIRTWCIVGDDYVWPRVSAAATRKYADELGLLIKDEIYVPYGTRDFTAPVERTMQSGADGVLMLLVGQDAVQFNRAFAARGLHEEMVRFSPLMEENMLLASGHAATQRLFVAASYFRSLATEGALELMGDYVRTFGPSAPPLNNAAESCYEGIQTLVSLAERAGSIETRQIQAVSETVGYDGPRGVMQMRRGHLTQQVYLAMADGYEFDVIAAL